MSHGASSNDPTRVSGRLSTAELARRLGVETTWVDRLAAAGAIEPAADGTYDPGDVHRVRLLLAFEESGVPLDVLIQASAAGRISLRYYDELHQPPTTQTGRTYEAFEDIGVHLGLICHKRTRRVQNASVDLPARTRL